MVSTASVTDDPQRLSDVLPQNKNKIVPLKSLSRVPYAELEAALVSIEAHLDKEQSMIDRIYGSLQWQMSNTTACAKDVSGLKAKLETVTTLLEAEDLKVASVPENLKLRGLIGRVQELGLRCVLMKKSIPTLSALTETDDLELLFKSFLLCLEDLHGNTDQFVEAADSIMQKYVAYLDPALEDLFKQIATSKEYNRLANDLVERLGEVRPKQMLRVEDQAKDAMRKMIFSLMLQYCYRLADEKNLEDKVSMWRLPLLNTLCGARVNYGESFVAPEILETYKSHNQKKYTFSQYVGWFSWCESRTLGETLEREVGLALEGLIILLTQHLTMLCKGEAVESDVLQASLCTLRKKFDTIFIDIVKAPFDGYRSPLCTYLLGLQWGFKEAQELLTLAMSCREGSKAAVRTALQKLNTFYQAAPSSDNLLEPLDAFHEAKRGDQRNSHDPFDAFFSRQLVCINEIHAHRGLRLLQLSEREKEVPTALFANDQAVDDELLSGYVSKRILQFLYFQAPVHDMELELVLHKKPMQGQLIDRYNEVHKKTAAVNDAASEIAHIQARAFSMQARDVLLYAEAWQKLFEYKKKYSKHNGCNEMYEMLVARQQKAVLSHGYPDIEQKEVAASNIEAWPTSNPEEFFRELQRVSIDRQYGFNSVCMKILVAALYAHDTNEQLLAQQMLNNLFRMNAYEANLQNLSNDIKDLIRENAASKVLAGVMNLSKQEVARITEIEDFTLSPRLQLLFYRLRKNKILDGELLSQIEAQFTDTVGEFEYARWLEPIEHLADNNPLAYLINASNK